MTTKSTNQDKALEKALKDIKAAEAAVQAAEDRSTAAANQLADFRQAVAQAEHQHRTALDQLAALETDEAAVERAAVALADARETLAANADRLGAIARQGSTRALLDAVAEAEHRAVTAHRAWWRARWPDLQREAAEAAATLRLAREVAQRLREHFDPQRLIDAATLPATEQPLDPDAYHSELIELEDREAFARTGTTAPRTKRPRPEGGAKITGGRAIQSW